VKDAATGNDVDYFYISIDKKSELIDGSKKTIQLHSKGKHKITIWKEGYTPVNMTVTANEDNIVLTILMYVVGLGIAGVLGYFGYITFIGKIK